MSAILAALVSGLLVGSMSGLVGIGGGILLVPILLYVFRIDMHLAAGTSLAIIIPTSIVASVVHFMRGNVDWHLAGLITVGAIVGALMGGWAGGFLPGDTLKKVFAVMLVVLSIKVAMDAFSISLPFGAAAAGKGQVASAAHTDSGNR